MRHSGRAVLGVLVVMCAVVSWSVVTVAGQSPKSAAKASPTVVKTPAKKWVAPRTPEGRPDMQGVWSFQNLTPLERPSTFGEKSSLSEEEAEEFARNRIETGNKDRRDGGAAADVERAYNDFWWDFGKRVSTQPSLVIDPKDGRVPPLTAEAARQRQANQGGPGGQRRASFDNPEDRPIGERCILGFNSGPPMVPSAYNNNVQIVQTRDYVVIVNEMIHSARVVPTDGRPHAPKEMRKLTGDSVGRWEGDTLVVDTTNFSRQGAFRGASINMHLIERFTRVDQDTLRYDFTVDDPATWTKSWTASIPMAWSEEPMFEYACHEGNHALESVLKGARYQETHPAPKSK